MLKYSGVGVAYKSINKLSYHVSIV